MEIEHNGLQYVTASWVCVKYGLGVDRARQLARRYLWRKMRVPRGYDTNSHVMFAKEDVLKALPNDIQQS
jgi:hypothetical protein